MFGHSIGIASGLALASSATAFIIPAGIDTHEPAFPVIANPKNQLLSISCSACVFPSDKPQAKEANEKTEDELFWIQGGANDVVLNFTVSEDGRSLELGGGKVYPFDGLIGNPRVTQVSSSASMAELEANDAKSASLEVTAWSFTVDGTPIKDIHENDHSDSFTVARFLPIALEEQSMPLDEVVVTLLEMGDGQLLIINVESRPNMRPSFPFNMIADAEDGQSDLAVWHRPSPPGYDEMEEEPESIGLRHHFPGLESENDDMPFPPHHGPPHGPPRGFGHHGPPGIRKECNMLPAPLCRFKNIVEAKITGIRQGDKPGCHGRKGKDGHVSLPTHIQSPHFKSEGHDEMTGPQASGRPHHGRPHHMRPHGDHSGHRHHRHSFFHSFAKGLVAVLIPVMVGVTVGMTVSLVGLLVGRLVSFLWIKYVRGGRRGYASVALTDSTTEEGEYRDAEIAEMEAPPVYEHAPEYDDVEKKVMEEK